MVSRTKKVATTTDNTEIDPCAELRRELDDISKESVPIRTTIIDTLIGWTQVHYRENQVSRRTTKKTVQNEDRIKELDVKAAYYLEIMEVLVRLRNAE